MSSELLEGWEKVKLPRWAQTRPRLGASVRFGGKDNSFYMVHLKVNTPIYPLQVVFQRSLLNLVAFIYDSDQICFLWVGKEGITETKSSLFVLE